MPRAATGQVVRYQAKDGAVTWSIRFPYRGKRYRYRLGHEPEWNQERAEQALADRLAEIRLDLWQPPAPAAEPEPEPETFQVAASMWYARRRGEVGDRTAEHWEWAISAHLLPAFGEQRISEITVRDVQRFTVDKIADREARAVALERWQSSDRRRRGRRPGPGLSNRSIEKVLAVAAMITDDAVDAELIAANPFRARRKRLRAEKPRRGWLEIEQVRALLDAARPEDRGILGVLCLAGLRISEACELRWRSVDLAGARLHIEQSKTDAGRRVVDVTPLLLDVLKAHRATARETAPGARVFTTRMGGPLDRANVRSRILAPSVKAADVLLSEAGRRPIGHATHHDLRRTYCALLFEAGASPGYCMQQMGHTTPSLALSIYNRVLERQRDTGERMSALLRGPVVDDLAVEDVPATVK